MGCSAINDIEKNKKNQEIISKNNINIEKKYNSEEEYKIKNISDNNNNDIIYIDKNEPEPEFEIIIGNEYLPPYEDLIDNINKND